eukprot:1765228-Prymnesium_polylepis.1
MDNDDGGFVAWGDTLYHPKAFDEEAQVLFRPLFGLQQRLPGRLPGIAPVLELVLRQITHEKHPPNGLREEYSDECPADWPADGWLMLSLDTTSWNLSLDDDEVCLSSAGGGRSLLACGAKGSTCYRGWNET